MKQQPKQEPRKPNDIRVRMDSRVSGIIRYCNSILKEKTATTLNFSAVGGAITKLVSAVEIIKIVNPGLYQSNKLGTVIFKSVENKETEEIKRLFPKLDVILSLDPLEKNEGFQDKYSEEERKKLFDIFTTTPTRRPRPTRSGFNGRQRRRPRTAGFRGRTRRLRTGVRRNLRPGFRGRSLRAAPRGRVQARGNTRTPNTRVPARRGNYGGYGRRRRY